MLKPFSYWILIKRCKIERAWNDRKSPLIFAYSPLWWFRHVLRYNTWPWRCLCHKWLFFLSLVCVPAIIAVGGCLSGEKRRVLSDWRSLETCACRTMLGTCRQSATMRKLKKNSQMLPFVNGCLSVVNTCPRQSWHITEDITCSSKISVARDDAIVADDAIEMNVSPNRSVSDDMKRMLDGVKWLITRKHACHWVDINWL